MTEVPKSAQRYSATKKVVLVVGRPNSGKSTVIQSLTGCNSSRFQGEIEDKKSKKKIYVIAASPEEKLIDGTGFNAVNQTAVLKAILNRVKTSPDFIGLVIAMQGRPVQVRGGSRLRIEDVVKGSKKCWLL